MRAWCHTTSLGARCALRMLEVRKKPGSPQVSTAHVGCGCSPCEMANGTTHGQTQSHSHTQTQMSHHRTRQTSNRGRRQTTPQTLRSWHRSLCKALHHAYARGGAYTMPPISMFAPGCIAWATSAQDSPMRCRTEAPQEACCTCGAHSDTQIATMSTRDRPNKRSLCLYVCPHAEGADINPKGPNTTWPHPPPDASS